MSDNDNSNIVWAQGLGSMVIKSCELQVGGVTMGSWYHCTTCKKQITIDLSITHLVATEKQQEETHLSTLNKYKLGEDKASVVYRNYNCPTCYSA